jgi:hypothetical protein
VGRHEAPQLSLSVGLQIGDKAFGEMDMRHTARSLLVEVLVPSFNSFLEYYETKVMGLRKDTSNAAIVAEACLHLTEYIYSEKKIELQEQGIKKIKDYKNTLYRKNKDFEYVCDFGNAWKHKELGRAQRTIDSINSVKEKCALVRFHDEQGYYFDTMKVVLIEVKDGNIYNLGDLMWSSIKMIIAEMMSLGMINTPPRIRTPRTKKRLRIEVPELPHIEYLGQVGEYFEIGHMLLDFDEINNRFIIPGGGIEFPPINVRTVIDASPFT